MSDAPIENGLVFRVCHGHSCGRRSQLIEDAVRAHIDAKGLEGEVAIATQSCFGRCALGANLLVERWRDGRPNDKAMFALMMNQKNPDIRFEHDVRPEEVPKIVDWHVRAWRRSLADEDTR